MEIKDLVYNNAHDLKLDIFYPEEVDQKKPTIVFIHGGGWVGGDKASGEENFWKKFTNEGFIVVSINYRLYPEGIYPENIYDTVSALNYLNDNADELLIDVDRVVLSGHSAGAYLALTTALREDLGRKLKPKVCICLYSPLDFYDTKKLIRFSLIDRIRFKHALELTQMYLGKTIKDCPDHFLKEASPIYYLKKDSLPILVQQGKKDQLLPQIQLRSLQKKIDETGNKQTQIEVFNKASHGSEEFFTDQNRNHILEFIRKYIQ